MAVLVAMAVIGLAGIGILAIAYEIRRAWEETNAGKDLSSFPFLTGGRRYAMAYPYVMAMRNNIGKDNCEVV